MKTTRYISLLLACAGIGCLALGILLMQFGVVLAYHDGPQFPHDYREWYHLGSKSIAPEAAEALGLPADVFGDTFDAVFANTIALNDLRSGTRPFRDGAAFAAPFYRLEHPVDGLDASGELLFVAVMFKDAEHFDETGGWGFEAFTPEGARLTDLRPSCFACHESQQENDYVFSTLAERAVSAVPAADNGVFLPPDYRDLSWVSAKVIRPEAAPLIGLPADLFGDTFSVVYANPSAQQALNDGARPFPVGTLFVADFHKAAYPLDGLAAYGDLAFTAVMLKGAPGTGDDASTGDWKFEAFGPDGAPLSALREACIACHAGQTANDFVFAGG